MGNLERGRGLGRGSEKGGLPHVGVKRVEYAALTESGGARG